MAFGKSNVSTESGISKFTGYASVFVKGVNATKAELEKFYGREIENEPVYTGVNKDTGKKQVRIEFLVEADKDSKLHPGVEFKSKVSFFLNEARKVGSDSGKIQVIDKYGNTAWVTEEQLAKKEIPLDKNSNPIRIAPDYRPAYDGEAELVEFLRCYLNIKSPFNYDKDKNIYVWKPQSELDDVESSLEHVADYFNGNVKELKEALALQPTNKLQVLFGVKGDYQDTFNRMFMKNGSTNYNKLAETVADAQAKGAYPSTIFEVSPLHKYEVVASDLNKPQSTDNPWGD